MKKLHRIFTMVLSLIIIFTPQSYMAETNDIDDNAIPYEDMQTVEDQIFDSENFDMEPVNEEIEYVPEDVVCVQFPDRIDFNIVTIEGYPKGLVDSVYYHVVNFGDTDVIVDVNSIYLELNDVENFCVSKTPELPETGNNIYMELFAICEDTTETFIVTDEPASAPFSFFLESGDEFQFKFQGTANELGSVPWSAENIRVKMVFNFTPTIPDYSMTIESLTNNGENLPELNGQEHNDVQESPVDEDNTENNELITDEIITDETISDEKPVTEIIEENIESEDSAEESVDYEDEFCEENTVTEESENLPESNGQGHDDVQESPVDEDNTETNELITDELITVETVSEEKSVAEL